MTDFDKLLKENLSTVRDMVASFPVRALQLYGPTEDNIDDFEHFVDEIVAPAGITHISIIIIKLSVFY